MQLDKHCNQFYGMQVTKLIRISVILNISPSHFNHFESMRVIWLNKHFSLEIHYFPGTVLITDTEKWIR